MSLFDLAARCLDWLPFSSKRPTSVRVDLDVCQLYHGRTLTHWRTRNSAQPVAAYQRLADGVLGAIFALAVVAAGVAIFGGGGL